MDNNNININSVELSENIVINYENDVVETLPKNIDTYKAFYDKWLVEDPPFISDIYKSQMRNIILACINNNQNCIDELNVFFSSPNEETVKKFFIYMRNRHTTLPEKKAIWKST
jgi:hypothetical protein